MFLNLFLPYSAFAFHIFIILNLHSIPDFYKFTLAKVPMSKPCSIFYGITSIQITFKARENKLAKQLNSWNLLLSCLWKLYPITKPIIASNFPSSVFCLNLKGWHLNIVAITYVQFSENGHINPAQRLNRLNIVWA